MYPFVRVLIFRLLILSTIPACVLWVYTTEAELYGIYYNHVPGFEHKVDLATKLQFFPFLVLTHHIFSKVLRKYWLNLYELVLLSSEVIVGLYYVVTMLLFNIEQAQDQPIFWGFLVSVLIMVTCLVMLFFAFVWDLALARGRNLLRPFHILGDVTNAQNKHSWDGSRMFFGRFMFKKRYRAENTAVRVVRGVFGGGIIAGFALHCFDVIIIRPLQYPTLRSQKYLEIDSRGWTSMNNIPLGGITVYMEGMDTTLDSIPDAIHVRAYHKDGLVNCTQVDPLYFNCAGEVLIDPLPYLHAEVWIDINFTRLANYREVPMLPSDRAINIIIGVAESLEDILETTLTHPLPVFSGMHLWATLSLSLQQRMISSILSSIGLRQYRSIPVINIEKIVPNVQPDTQEPGISTVRMFFPQAHLGPRPYKVLQDVRDNSVLSGISIIGGVWTSINAIFAVIFGCSLLLTVFGIKPLSIYGIVHFLQGGRASLAEGSSLSSDEQMRVIALLREHLMDNEEQALYSSESKNSEAPVVDTEDQRIGLLH